MSITNTMDPYKQILESTIFLFDWGQDNQNNHCTSLTDLSFLTSGHILNADPFTDAIARYHNWYRTFSTKDPSQARRKDVIAFRQDKLGIIHSRMINELPNHPAIRIYKRECQLYDAQDCISRLPLNCD